MVQYSVNSLRLARGRCGCGKLRCVIRALTWTLLLKLHGFVNFPLASVETLHHCWNHFRGRVVLIDPAYLGRGRGGLQGEGGVSGCDLVLGSDLMVLLSCGECLDLCGGYPLFPCG